MLFTAGHGFYHFAITKPVFDRSLYYNLLLQPKLAIPDHYLLQGDWIAAHLQQYPGRDSWLEVGLRNEFIVPYFRYEGRSLQATLSEMVTADRRGFNPNANDIAERLSRTPSTPRYWASADNSKTFSESVLHYLTADDPPMMELGAGLDPEDFSGFWVRSREWIDEELTLGRERSTARLGTDGMLLSQMMQVSAERVLGPDCGEIANISELLTRVRDTKGPSAFRDLRALYTLACELYNRSLSDTLFTDSNSPRWRSYIAALDLWRDQLASQRNVVDLQSETDLGFEVIIKLPKIAHLRNVSGDTLLSIRKSAACERFFESLSNWKAQPMSPLLRTELVGALEKYSEVIVKQAGDSIGLVGLRPQFVSRASDILRLVDRTPQFVQGVLAAAGIGATAVEVPTGAQLTLFGLFGLLTAAKYVVPYSKVPGSVALSQGVRLHGDVTVSRSW
jgi:hypothetical protein